MAEGTIQDVPAEIQTKILEVVREHLHLESLKSMKIEKVTANSGNFRIYDDNDSTKSVIVKLDTAEGTQQGPDVGEIEWMALNKFDGLAQGSVIKPLFYNKDLKLLCLEDLRGYVVYRTSLIDGHIDDDAALKLARDVAIIHRDTHVAKIGQEAIKQLDTQFKNVSSLASRERLLFTAPFSRDDTTNRCSDAVKAKLDWLYGDQEVIQAASNMKKVFLEKKEALIHGDLHTGSVMVKDEDARLINAEFTYVGPCSLDLGILIANYIFSYYCNLMCPEDNDNRRVIAYRVVEICNQMVDEYFKHMTSVTGDSEMFYAKFISEVAGFAGCEIIRRLVGAHHVAEFEATADAEVDALGAGVRLLKAYHRIHSIGTLMLIALMLA